MSDEKDTRTKHARDHSGARVITETGAVHDYQPRSERSVLKNGTLATDLIQTSIPRWKVWLGHVFDIGKYIVAGLIVITQIGEPHAERWVGNVIDKRSAALIERLTAQERSIAALQESLRAHLAESETYPRRDELERVRAELQSQIFLLKQQTERIR